MSGGGRVKHVTKSRRIASRLYIISEEFRICWLDVQISADRTEHARTKLMYALLSHMVAL